MTEASVGAATGGRMSGSSSKYPLTSEEKVYFRDELRKARAAALRDAEGYQEVLFSIERFGSKLIRKGGTLADYAGPILSIAGQSVLARRIPKRWKECHTHCPHLFDMVKDGRNDAMHQGAYARHLTTHAIELALVLEDALMAEANRVGDYMVREPTCAYLWQPISFIRQIMLINSFSYLPVAIEGERGKQWRLISDYAIARYLRQDRDKRDTRLATSLHGAIEDDGLDLDEASLCKTDTSVSDALKMSDGRPVLVYRDGAPDELLSIVTPFDLL